MGKITVYDGDEVVAQVAAEEANRRTSGLTPRADWISDRAIRMRSRERKTAENSD